jgi:protein-disulfide isomerase
MHRFFHLALPVRKHSKRTSLFLSLAAAAFLVAATTGAYAQFGGPGTTQVRDTSALRPPAGARVAIVEFSDLECPDCARANPLLREAVAKYHIPLITHDFPLPYHAWTTNAMISARWFESKNKKLGEEYRDQVYANQGNIYNLNMLSQFTQKFARERGIALPFSMDPQGKFAIQIKADYALGQRIGIEHTPTIWVVTAHSKGAPFVEVVDRSKLFQLIDQAIADTSAAPAHKPVHKK